MMTSDRLQDIPSGRVLAAFVTADVCERLHKAGLDGLGGILFADENFQEAKFGLDPLVLPILLQHRHPVLLLNVSAGEREKPDLNFQVLMKPPLHALKSKQDLSHLISAV